MKTLSTAFDGKPLAPLSVGCMRFPSREAASEVIHTAVSLGICYLDTSPCYCFRSEEENSETWVGAAIKGNADKVILSAKSSTGNGGNSIGEYDPRAGFSITTSDQVRQEIEQSLRRLDTDSLDLYQLWAAHTREIFDKALEKNGWLDGALKAKDAGLFRHLGFTSHAGNDDLLYFIDTGLFEAMTVPFHIMDISRLDAIKHALKKGMAVTVMNPLAGGFLASGDSPLIRSMLDGYNIKSLSEMALRFCNAFGVSALSGMTCAGEVRLNAASVDKPQLSEEDAMTLYREFNSLLDHDSFTCTGCGYCMPCPMKINIPEVLRTRNHYAVLGLKEAEKRLKNWHNDYEGYRIENCSSCGLCESKCPNGVKVRELFDEIKLLWK